jgi:hypothetical protein
MSSRLRSATRISAHIAANACFRGSFMPRSQNVRSGEVIRRPASSTISEAKSSRWPLLATDLRIRPPGRRNMSTGGTCRWEWGSSTIGAPSNQAAVRSVTTASSGTTSLRQASRRSRQSGSWDACMTPWTGASRRPARTQARSRRGSMPWARAHVVVNGRSVGTGAAEVRNGVSEMSMAQGCPGHDVPNQLVRPPVDRPSLAELSQADSARFRRLFAPTRRVLHACLRRLGVM